MFSIGHHSIQKTVIIIVDSLGAGALPDSLIYGGQDINCMSHTSESVEKFNIPYLGSLGLGKITYVKNGGRPYETKGFYGKISPLAPGLEKLIAYWEMMGIQTDIIPTTFHNEEIPEEIIHKFKVVSQYNLTGGRYEDCQTALQRENEEHQKNKSLIINTSFDGSVQILADTKVIPINDFYKACFSMRRICDQHKIMRLVAKPYRGSPPEFLPEQEKVFAMPAPQPGILSALSIRDIPVYSVGNVSDFFNDIGFYETYKTGSYTENLEKGLSLLRNQNRNVSPREVIMVEYNHGYYNSKIDTDFITHYAAFIEKLDSFIPKFMDGMHNEDILMILGDQPKDPTVKNSIFTREYIPILIFSKTFKPYDIGNLGIRSTFIDVAMSIAEMYGFDIPYSLGESFWYKISSQI